MYHNVSFQQTLHRVTVHCAAHRAYTVYFIFPDKGKIRAEILKRNCPSVVLFHFNAFCWSLLCTNPPPPLPLCQWPLSISLHLCCLPCECRSQWIAVKCQLSAWQTQCHLSAAASLRQQAVNMCIGVWANERKRTRASGAECLVPYTWEDSLVLAVSFSYCQRRKVRMKLKQEIKHGSEWRTEYVSYICISLCVKGRAAAWGGRSKGRDGQMEGGREVMVKRLVPGQEEEEWWRGTRW